LNNLLSEKIVSYLILQINKKIKRLKKLNTLKHCLYSGYVSSWWSRGMDLNPSNTNLLSNNLALTQQLSWNICR